MTIQKTEFSFLIIYHLSLITLDVDSSRVSVIEYRSFQLSGFWRRNKRCPESGRRLVVGVHAEPGERFSDLPPVSSGSHEERQEDK